MIRRVGVFLILTFLLSACGGAATIVPETEAPAAATELPAEATEAPPDSLLVEATVTLTPEPTFTPSITPTETPLPPLDLPTEIANAPAQLAWDGAPTYLGDSLPGYAFRLMYDPDLWAVTEDLFGFPALGHRAIPYCVIAVTAGRGTAPTVTVEHDVLYTGAVTFDVATAYENGVKKSVTFTGGDGTILTAFEVTFQAEADTCLADAITVLATLTSVPVSQATPQP